MIAPEDCCDLCREPAEVDDSDLGLCSHCRAELWLHTRCAESGGPCPRCGGLWTDKPARAKR